MRSGKELVPSTVQEIEKKAIESQVDITEEKTYDLDDEEKSKDKGKEKPSEMDY